MARDDLLEDTNVLTKPAFARPEQVTPVLVAIAGLDAGALFTLDRSPMVLGRDDDCDITVFDAGLSRNHCRFVAEGGRLVVEDLESTNGTWVNYERADRVAIAEGDRIALGESTVLKFDYLAELEVTHQRRLYSSTLQDALTGVYNRRYLTRRLEEETAYAARHQTCLTMLLFDLDEFKQINDTHGHLVGDRVLEGLAAIVGESIRLEDVFARYGGDEFAIVARGLDEEAGPAFGERVRELVAGAPFEVDGEALQVTISVGTATFTAPAPSDAGRLLRLADDALYVAKARGRNRVERAEAATPGRRASARVAAKTVETPLPARPSGE